MLTNFKHPGIVQLRYSFQDKTSLYFVQEYCQGGEFISFIKANFNKLTERARIFYIAEIVNLLEYLHGNGVTHRDLKVPPPHSARKPDAQQTRPPQTHRLRNSRNIQLQTPQARVQGAHHQTQTEGRPNPTGEKGRRGSPRVTRNGLSPQEEEVDLCGHLLVSQFLFSYISPELLEQNYCPPSADLWALGCIIYQIYYMETPFKDSYEFAVFEKIKKAEYSFPKVPLPHSARHHLRRRHRPHQKAPRQKPRRTTRLRHQRRTVLSTPEEPPLLSGRGH